MTGPSHRIFRAEVPDLVRSGAPAARPALARRLALCGVLSLATLAAAAAPPILDNIPDQTVIQDHPTDGLLLGIQDSDTPLLALQLSGTSSNPGLVSQENIFFGIAGGSWYLTATPTFGQTGTAIITVTVSDETASATDSLVLTVSSPPPGAARFANTSPITLPESGPATPYPSQIQVSGMPAAVTRVIVTLSRFSHERVSDVDMLLVGPTGQGVVIFSGISGGNRSATNVTVNVTDAGLFPLPADFALWSEPLRPADFTPGDFFPGAPPGPYGPVSLSTFNGLPANGTWSLYVHDALAGRRGQIAGGWSLMIATNAATVKPTISTLPDQVIVMNSATEALPFTIGDPLTPPGALTVTASSSNPTLVPGDNIALGGSDAHRTVKVTPATGVTGTSRITLTVDNGANTASSSFVLTVTEIKPTISTVPDQFIVMDSATEALPFTIGDPLTLPGALTVTASSSNPTLVPDDNIALGGSDAHRTVKVTPATGETGTSRITLTVDNGAKTASSSFFLTVSELVPGMLFTNSSFVSIPAFGLATPYPSTIAVTDVPGLITRVTVTIHTLRHTYPADVDILLVGPSGHKVILFSDAGGGGDLFPVTVTLSDEAPSSLPLSDQIVSGFYKPTDYEPGELGELDDFPGAPEGPYSPTLSVFNGLSANGTWSLYAVDDGPGDLGSIDAGWSIAVITASAPTPPTISSIQRLANERVQIRGTGEAGAAYAVQVSPDLNQWQAIGTTTAAESGAFEFEDPDAGVLEVRFYRLISQ